MVLPPPRLCSMMQMWDAQASSAQMHADGCPATLGAGQLVCSSMTWDTWFRSKAMQAASSVCPR